MESLFGLYTNMSTCDCKETILSKLLINEADKDLTGSWEAAFLEFGFDWYQIACIILL